MKLLALYKLFRVKPVVAWSVSGFLLAVSVAINEFGFNLNWNYLTASLFILVIIQAFLAHAVNDLVDEKVDRITDMKSTNRAKVLLDNLATRKELYSVSVLSLLSVLMIMTYLYTRLGYLILIFGAVGIYAPLAYSVRPLKLGWRPFSEWTVVFPTLITLVVAVNFVATGRLSILAFYTGVIFSLFSIMWFLISRYMDYEPDKKAGKITSAVKLGTYNFMAYYCIFMLLLSFFLLLLILFINTIFFVSAIFSILVIKEISESNFMNPISASALRTELIILSSFNSLVLSALYIVF